MTALLIYAIAIIMSSLAVDYYVYEELGVTCQYVAPDAVQCEEGRQ